MRLALLALALVVVACGLVLLLAYAAVRGPPTATVEDVCVWIFVSGVVGALFSLRPPERAVAVRVTPIVVSRAVMTSTPPWRGPGDSDGRDQAVAVQAD